MSLQGVRAALGKVGSCQGRLGLMRREDGWRSRFGVSSKVQPLGWPCACACQAIASESMLGSRNFASLSSIATGFHCPNNQFCFARRCCYGYPRPRASTTPDKKRTREHVTDLYSSLATCQAAGLRPSLDFLRGQPNHYRQHLSFSCGTHWEEGLHCTGTFLCLPPLNAMRGSAMPGAMAKRIAFGSAWMPYAWGGTL